MNINPLANQRSSYRLLVLLLILATAVLSGWIVAQFFLPKKSQSPLHAHSFLHEVSFVEDMESELMECDLLFSLKLPKEDRYIRQRQINIMAQKLAAFERRLQRVAQSGNLDPYTFREFQQRSQRMQMQLQLLLQDQAKVLNEANPRLKTHFPNMHPYGNSAYQYKRTCVGKSLDRNRRCFKEYYLPRH